MLKTGYVKCPTCGGEVVEFGTIDFEADTASITVFKIGECDRCGNHYQWHDKYTLAGYRDLERIHDKSKNKSDDIP